MTERRVEVGCADVLVYRGVEIDCALLDVVLGKNSRVLWAFISKDDRIMAVPYGEDQCIWMTPEDVMQPNEVEV